MGAGRQFAAEIRFPHIRDFAIVDIATDKEKAGEIRVCRGSKDLGSDVGRLKSDAIRIGDNFYCADSKPVKDLFDRYGVRFKDGTFREVYTSFMKAHLQKTDITDLVDSLADLDSFSPIRLETVRYIVKHLTADDAEKRINSSFISTLLNALSDVIDDPDTEVRHLAVIGLRRFAEKSAVAYAALRRALNDSELAVRASAATRLADTILLDQRLAAKVSEILAEKIKDLLKDKYRSKDDFPEMAKTALLFEKMPMKLSEEALVLIAEVINEGFRNSIDCWGKYTIDRWKLLRLLDAKSHGIHPDLVPTLLKVFRNDRAFNSAMAVKLLQRGGSIRRFQHHILSIYKGGLDLTEDFHWLLVGMYDLLKSGGISKDKVRDIVEFSVEMLEKKRRYVTDSLAEAFGYAGHLWDEVKDEDGDEMSQRILYNLLTQIYNDRTNIVAKFLRGAAAMGGKPYPYRPPALVAFHVVGALGVSKNPWTIAALINVLGDIATIYDVDVVAALSKWVNYEGPSKLNIPKFAEAALLRMAVRSIPKRVGN